MPAPWGQERNRDGGEAACHSGDRHEEVDLQRATDLPLLLPILTIVEATTTTF